ncbi:MBOAT family O-acyltransferase [Castellaniella sp.]|uniref:MBOAT family O-acyltransferase n=1 Tax=Castellaniella sp. TaxID=1955812 RepID=UPI002AFF558F|nr:MBOAT family O-acyltransferase [Castellaniella sp.]
MGFLSLEFAGAFVLFLVPYWACRRSPGVQNLLALAAGYFFLANLHPWFALILGLYTAGVQACAWLIQVKPSRISLAVSLSLAVLNLAIFKYFDFFRDAINAALTAWGLSAWIPAIQIMAPLGISFYTFHSVSYLVSVWRKEIPLVPLADLALFLGFFPSVVAGPINRARDFLPQIQTVEPRSLSQYPKALLLIVLAILKVVWLSAWLANTWADPVFANPQQYHALDALLGLLAYTWQLYLNFSGYTDLVTGLALLLGFQLPPNFRAPYLATNLRHFWSRWHISLSTWIRDYLYIPLGGSRQGFTRTQINLMIALVLSGLWHGASGNFLIWGAVHGAGMVLLNLGDRLWGRDRVAARLPILANTATFLFVALAWIFFRSPSLDQSLLFLQTLVTHFDQALQFNSPLYLLLMWLALRSYPLIARACDGLLHHIARLPWGLQPLLLAPLAWAGLFLSPAGIPGFIYAGF